MLLESRNVTAATSGEAWQLHRRASSRDRLRICRSALPSQNVTEVFWASGTLDRGNRAQAPEADAAAEDSVHSKRNKVSGKVRRACHAMSRL
jgi:hypothetical protein